MAFVVDVFSRRIVGWRHGNSTYTEFVFDALEQAVITKASLGFTLVSS